jgi:hypothetical protein
VGEEIFEKYPNLPKKVVAFIKSLLEMVSSLRKAIADRDAELEALKEKNSRLEERLNLNSRNSSIPPHADGYRKRAAGREDHAEPESKTAGDPDETPSKNRSLRKKSGRKPGGQSGHKGSGFMLSGDPGRIEEHIPGECVGCQWRPGCDKSRVSVSRQNELNLLIRFERCCHITYQYSCPMRNGEKMTGTKPFEGTNRYGDSVTAFTTLLYSIGVVSYDRIKKILAGLTGRSISTGTLRGFIMTAHGKVGDAVGHIRQKLTASPLIHADETGLRVAGVLKWLHTACTTALTYLSVQGKRGEEGMRAAGVLGRFTGTLVTDCWASYFKFKDIVHALCNAHVLRELLERWQRTKQEWTRAMIELLLRIHEEKHELMDQGISGFTPERLEHYSDMYSRITAEGICLNPIPERKPKQRGRIKRGKTRALLERLVEHKDDFLRFAYDFSVPFTNNEAEISLRGARVRECVSKCFRTDEGAQAWADIMSYTGTAAKNGESEYEAIKQLVSGNALDFIKKITAGKC